MLSFIGGFLFWFMINNSLFLSPNIVATVSEDPVFSDVDILNSDPIAIGVLKTIVLSSLNPEGIYEHEYLLPAVDIAAQKAQAHGIRLDRDRRYLKSCRKGSDGLGIVYEVIQNIRGGEESSSDYDGVAPRPVQPTVFLVSGCSADTLNIAALISYFNFAWVAMGQNHDILSTWHLPSTVRTAFSARNMVQPLLSLFELFKWKDISVIYYRPVKDEIGENPWIKYKDGFLPRDDPVKHFNFAPVRIKYYYHERNTDPRHNLKKARQHSRVFVIFADPGVVRAYMLAASDERMTDGEFVYIAFDMLLKEIVELGKQKSWRRGDSLDARAKEAYQSLLILSTNNRTDTKPHNRFVKELETWHSFNPNYKFPEEIQNPSYLLKSHHDAVLLAALCAKARLNDPRANDEILEFVSPIDPKRPLGADSNAWFQESYARTYLWNKSGLRLNEQLLIDESGDIMDEYQIYDMTNLADGTFEAVFKFSCCPDGVCDRNTCASRKIPNTPKVDWGGNRKESPPNKPPCGFDGQSGPCKEKRDRETLMIATLIPTAVVLLVLLRYAILYFKRRANAWNWLIPPTDLKVQWPDGKLTEGVADNGRHSSKGSMGSGGSAGTHHTSHQGYSYLTRANESMLMANMRANFGMYRNQPVVVRHCFKRVLLKQRHLAIEAEEARQMDHENILKFYKATIAINHVAVVYVGPVRGSLMDIIAAKPPMDWVVRFNFLNDLIKGLQYLYSNWLTCHGRLTSTCLFLDSRFTLKINDHGLPSFFNLSVVELWFARKDKSFSASQLWTPPELLREQNPVRAEKLMTKAVDIYSIGIILQELLLWSRPYSMFPKLTPTDIVTFVQRGQNDEGAQMRPRFSETLSTDREIIQLAQRCWSEEVRERPDLSNVKSALNEAAVKAGAKIDAGVLDSLLAQMEKLMTTLDNSIKELDEQTEFEQKKRHLLMIRYVPIFFKDHSEVKPTIYPHVTAICLDFLLPSILCTDGTPSQIIRLMDTLYDLLMKAGHAFNLIKAEHFQDILVVISGAPTPIPHHANHAAKYALHLFHDIRALEIPHKPDVRLKPRIGMHSSSIAGGILQTKIPRYFVEGPAVSIGLRMLHTAGNSPAIHISQTTRDQLDPREFVTEKRGTVSYINEQIPTYWLHGKHYAISAPYKSDVARTGIFKRPSFLQ